MTGWNSLEAILILLFFLYVVPILRFKENHWLRINIVGGAWVLVSYSNSTPELWGVIPSWLRPIYVASMLLAALGYVVFTLYLLLNPRKFDPQLINGLYCSILVPSALWIHFALERFRGVQILLFWTAIGAGGVLFLLGRAWGQRKTNDLSMALLGSFYFFFHVLVFDALLWPSLFFVSIKN